MNEMYVKDMWHRTVALSFADAKAWQARLDATLTATTAVLNAYPKSAIGLTPDHIKATAEWKGNYRANQLAFDRLRRFNQVFVRTFKKELAAERKAKRNKIATP